MDATPVPKLTVFVNGSIEEMDAEEYALRVVLAEGGICENEASLKSLAVAARSCALYFSLFGLKHQDFDVCADRNCCIPLCDVEKADKNRLSMAKKAVEETRGEALTLNDIPALALFTHCAGSATRQCEGFSYLEPIREDGKCDIHDLSLKVTPKGILKNLSENECCVVFNENKKCVLGVFGNNVVSGDELARLLSLPSVEFTLEHENGEIKAVCNGIGHGYGLNLCQAEKRAKKGTKYKSILETYFPKLILKQIY